MVVTVPEEPRNFSAPPSTYNWPMPAGDVVGAVALPIPITLAADVPAAVVPTNKLPLAFSVIAWVNVMAVPKVPAGAVYQACDPEATDISYRAVKLLDL